MSPQVAGLVVLAAVLAAAVDAAGLLALAVLSPTVSRLETKGGTPRLEHPWVQNFEPRKTRSKRSTKFGEWNGPLKRFR